jgi:uncharacterized membrane protein
MPKPQSLWADCVLQIDAMGLSIMILGLVLFLGGHAFVPCRKARAAAIGRIGELAYKGVFALVSLVGLALIVYGFAAYRAGGLIEVWQPPSWMRHVTAALVWPAIILITAAYIRGEIYRRLKHPMLAGVKLWAFAHLLANGDLGGIILFGSVLAWAVFDRISLKRRSDAGAPPIPVGGFRNDIIAVVVGTAAYLALGLWFHPRVIGLTVFGS